MKRILSIIVSVLIIGTITVPNAVEAKTKTKVKKQVPKTHQTAKVSEIVVSNTNQLTGNVPADPQRNIKIVNGQRIEVFADGSMFNLDTNQLVSDISPAQTPTQTQTVTQPVNQDIQQPTVNSTPIITPTYIPLNEDNVDHYADGVGWIAIRDGDGKLLGHGTGWLIKLNGDYYAITNLHVITDDFSNDVVSAELHMESPDLLTHGFYML